MLNVYNYQRYILKKQVLAMTGVFRVFAEDGTLALYSRQKMFRLREDIRVFADEQQNQEMLAIQARQILDFSAAYDVRDSRTGEWVGTLRRKGLASIARDEWEVLDPRGQLIGLLFEDTLERALLRRLFAGTFFPQDYDLFMGQRRVADLRQRFHLFRYELVMDFSEDLERRLDRRLGLAAGILLAAIEGKQHDY